LDGTGGDDNGGSNNWVLDGYRTDSGKPLVANDPHIPYYAVSIWHEIRLHGGSFNVAGVALAGMPGVMIGRNEHVAWGITNNICSLRDLYQERTDPAHPGCFLFDNRWERQRELVEVIHVKGSESVTRTIRCSRNGPIVDEILPPPSNATGPVSLKWLGAAEGGWLTALLQLDRARDVREFREALRPWHVPTFNLVAADVEGHILVQSTGRIPIRNQPERGYRPGWDPEHQWLGLLPFESMPGWIDPPRGWLVTANNRLAGHDFPFALYGGWISGYRAIRIREMIEARLAGRSAGDPGLALDDFRRMQHDTISLRAVACLPPLLAELSAVKDPLVEAAVQHLRNWDGRCEPELVAPTLFNVFFTFWSKAVAEARFSGPTAELLARQAEGIASRLLAEDPHGWFAPGQRTISIRCTFRNTLDYLAQRFGPNVADWPWGRLHRLDLKHVLSSRGDLGQLLDHGGMAVKGDTNTVCNTSTGTDWQAVSGAGYRLIVDLSSDGLWAVDAPSQSGQVATPHYSDQLSAWLAGDYHFLPLSRDAVAKIAVHQLECVP
jgi:penicillin amidase